VEYKPVKKKNKEEETIPNKMSDGNIVYLPLANLATFKGDVAEEFVKCVGCSGILNCHSSLSKLLEGELI